MYKERKDVPVLDEMIERVVKHERFRSHESLDMMSDDNPWKSSQGLSVKQFIEKNFLKFKPYSQGLESLLQEHCKELFFVKYFVDKLNREYWFCIYYLGVDEEDSPRYCIGGEPENEVHISEALKEKSDWRAFPEFLDVFWKVHGIWESTLSYGEDDFGLETLAKRFVVEYANGEVPHVGSLQYTAKELDINDWVALKNGICIDFSEDISEEEEDDFEYILFFEKYIQKAIYFTDTGSGDIILVINPYKDFSQLFYLCHDGCSNFYTSFGDYLVENFAYLIER